MVMTTPFEFSVTRAAWPADEAALRAVRTAVFIFEQRVPVELEWDGRDAECGHVLARDASGVAMGTGRLLPEQKIGRMAVLARARGQGVGAAILRELLQMARERGYDSVELSAQTHALGFYVKAGFAVISEEYLDAGIPHRSMRLQLGV